MERSEIENDIDRAEDEGMCTIGPLPTLYDEIVLAYKAPIATGVLDYFPDAIEEVAYVSLVCNEQHNPGEPMHWDRTKSQDEANSHMRHFMQRGGRDAQSGCRHSAMNAWRALALLQKEIEEERDGR